MKVFEKIIIVSLAIKKLGVRKEKTKAIAKCVKGISIIVNFFKGEIKNYKNK